MSQHQKILHSFIQRIGIRRLDKKLPNPEDVIKLCHQLVSNNSETTLFSLAKTILENVSSFTEQQKKPFFLSAIKVFFMVIMFIFFKHIQLMKKSLSLILFLIFCTQIHAHKPVLHDNSSYPPDAPYEIEDPEISKAIYSTLSGDAHFYRIESVKDFNFYAGILAAKIGECALEEKFSFEVLNSEFHLIYLADGENFEWTPWYEEYGKQWYWNGPEIGENFRSNEVFKAGTYYIKVFNNSNIGQYIIAVGDIEKFSLLDIVGLVFSMGKIEDEFWDPNLCVSG